MKAYGRGALLLFTAVTVAVITTITTLHGQSQINDKAVPANDQPQRTEQDERVPVVDFSSPEHDDPRSPEQRRKRNARHDNKFFVRNDDSYSSAVSATLNTDWDLGLPPLPTAQSAVVLIGEVSAGRAHLSNDKTGIYSEFPVRIEEVLKNASSSTLSVGGQVFLERVGGAVRYPNGRKFMYSVGGQNMPGVGLRYVFFLKSAGDEQSFEIVTAYELRGDKVMPLDSPGQFDAYKEMGQAKFLEQLRNAIGR